MMTDKDLAIHDQKMRAEIAKLTAEAAKINKEKDRYVAIVASTATLAIVTVVKLFFVSH